MLVSGRPLDISAQLPDWRALIEAWLPGTEGHGVADVLFGGVAPTGKLPVSWPQTASQEPVNDGDGKTPLFPLGFGLTWPAPLAGCDLRPIGTIGARPNTCGPGN